MRKLLRAFLACMFLIGTVASCATTRPVIERPGITQDANQWATNPGRYI